METLGRTDRGRGAAGDLRLPPRRIGSTSAVAELTVKLGERTTDLQRLQAEYINYKRRVDRDRETVRGSGIESVLKDFLSVLDDIRSAREHEELTGGFKAVAEEVERIAGKYGLVAYGVRASASTRTSTRLCCTCTPTGRRPDLCGDPAAGLPVQRQGAPAGAGRRRRAGPDARQHSGPAARTASRPVEPEPTGPSGSRRNW